MNLIALVRQSSLVTRVQVGSVIITYGLPTLAERHTTVKSFASIGKGPILCKSSKRWDQSDTSFSDIVDLSRRGLDSLSSLYLDLL